MSQISIIEHSVQGLASGRPPSQLLVVDMGSGPPTPAVSDSDMAKVQVLFPCDSSWAPVASSATRMGGYL